MRRKLSPSEMHSAIDRQALLVALGLAVLSVIGLIWGLPWRKDLATGECLILRGESFQVTEIKQYGVIVQGYGNNKAPKYYIQFDAIPTRDWQYRKTDCLDTDVIK